MLSVTVVRETINLLSHQST